MSTQTHVDPTSAAPATAPVRAGLLQRQCACGGGQCDECRKKKLQRHAHVPTSSQLAPPIVGDALSSPGQPLDRETRSFFEGRFRHDFADVQVHADHTASASARAVGANAYTVGHDIVFDAGRYQPQDRGGRELLAHELTHVVQQRGGPGRPQASGLAIDGDLGAEREAEQVARQITHGSESVTVSSAAGPGIARQPVPAKDAVEEDILQELASAHLASGLERMRPDHPVWKKLDPLWMVGLLKLLERAGQLGYLHVLDDAVDQAVGIFRERLRLAIDAVKLKAGKGPISNVDEAFLVRLKVLPEQQQSEIVSFVSGGAKVVGITPSVRPGQGTLDDLKRPAPAAATSGRSVAAMSNVDKLSEAAKYAAVELGPEVGKRLLELLTPESLATLAAFLAAYIVSQATPAGWVADVIGGGLLLVSVVMVGMEIIEIVEQVIAYSEGALNAKSEADLKAAGGHLATAVSKAGIDIVVAILFKKAGKAAAKPYMRPPPPAELRAFEITTKGTKPTAVDRFAANDNAFPFNENLRGSNVIDLSARRPNASSGGGGFSGNNALSLAPDAQPRPGLMPDAKAAPKVDPAPLKLPAPDPKMSNVTAAGAAAAAAQASEKKERKQCHRQWQPRRGGQGFTNYHNEFAAAMVSRFRLPASPEMDYSVAKGGKESTDYDSYDSRSDDLYEFKTRHQILKYDEVPYASTVGARVAAQAADQENTRVVCGFKGKLIWIFDRQDVANAARPLLVQMGVDIVQAEPWSP